MCALYKAMGYYCALTHAYVHAARAGRWAGLAYVFVLLAGVCLCQAVRACFFFSFVKQSGEKRCYLKVVGKR